ncbi:hypothetical protein ACFWH1_23200 [Streptomyces sp. NPDC127037]|uniref:hypothetical protein n=1 Tax=Streptomyces sp. NPDC127037 TaxID=3347113 RepID=UPI003659A349
MTTHEDAPPATAVRKPVLRRIRRRHSPAPGACRYGRMRWADTVGAALRHIRTEHVTRLGPVQGAPTPLTT